MPTDPSTARRRLARQLVIALAAGLGLGLGLLAFALWAAGTP